MKLGDVCIKITSGGTPKSNNSTYYGGKIPWLRTQEINFTEIKHTELHITEDGYNNSSTKWIPADSVIVAMYGATAGKSAINKIPLTTNQACCNLIIDSTKADYRYVYYQLKLNYEKLVNLANGGAQQNLNVGTIADFNIDFPPLTVQQAIADILSTIDTRISTNKAINDNLEQMAQAIFKNWFVDFEPWGGEQPPDWREAELGDVSTLSAGGDKPTVFTPIPTSECAIPVFSNGVDNLGLYGYTDRAKITDESVTVSARGTIGFVCLRQDPFVPIVRLVTVVPNSSVITAKYLYLYLNSIHISGVGTTQQQLTVPDFKKYHVLIPSFEATQNFTTIVDPIFDIIRHKRDENGRLIVIRDALLPRLMSGELAVADLRD